MTGSPLSSDQQQALLVRLARLTTRGLLNWTAEGESDSSFVAEVGGLEYRIVSMDGDGYAPYALYVYRAEESTPVLSITTLESAPATSRDLEDVYGAAERRARNWDGLAEEIFGALDRLEDGPAS